MNEKNYVDILISKIKLLMGSYYKTNRISKNK